MSHVHVTDRILEDLKCLGFAPEIENHGANHSSVIVIDYKVENGRYRGQSFKLGISLYGSTYLEMPPHFIHLCPVIAELQDGKVHATYTTLNKNGNSEEWISLSRPPNFWDRLAPEEKTMKVYCEHLLQFWSNV